MPVNHTGGFSMVYIKETPYEPVGDLHPPWLNVDTDKDTEATKK